MKYNFRGIKLEINKTRRIQIIVHRNFRTDINFDFPSGAIELYTYESNKRYFKDLRAFHMQIQAMPYTNYEEYNLPKDFFEKEYVLEKLSRDEFQYLSDGYFNSFSDHSRDTLWESRLKLADFELGYKVEVMGTGLYLLGQTNKSYFSFIYQSID